MKFYETFIKFFKTCIGRPGRFWRNLPDEEAIDLSSFVYFRKFDEKNERGEKKLCFSAFSSSSLSREQLYSQWLKKHLLITGVIGSGYYSVLHGIPRQAYIPWLSQLSRINRCNLQYDLSSYFYLWTRVFKSILLTCLRCVVVNPHNSRTVNPSLAIYI